MRSKGWPEYIEEVDLWRWPGFGGCVFFVDVCLEKNSRILLMSVSL